MKKYLVLVIILIFSFSFYSLKHEYNSILLEVQFIHKLNKSKLTDFIILDQETLFFDLITDIRHSNSLDEIYYHRGKSECSFFCKTFQLQRVDPSLGFIDYEFRTKLLLPLFINIVFLILMILLFYKVLKENIKLELIKKDRETLKALEKVSRQVFHDVSSPIIALEHLFKEIKFNLTPEHRLTYKEILHRIKGIINNLNSSTILEDINEKDNVYFSIFIKRLISQKELEYKNITGVEINYIDSTDSNELIRCHLNSLVRVLSNILNNSVEARKVNEKIIIDINISEDENKIFLNICDNGSGIDSKYLQDIFSSGFTRKKDGQGLGLSFVKEFCELEQIKYCVTSEVNCGTQFSFAFPKYKKPSWFVNKIDIEGDKICIVEDDKAIHRIWKNKLENKELIFFDSLFDFEKWILNIDKDEYFYLIDYEFIGEKATGVDIIKRNRLHEKSILVTTHFDNKELLKTIETLELKIFPKELIHNDEEKLEKIVLIDDDPFIRKIWQRELSEYNIHCFESFEDCISSTYEFNLLDMFYIDLNLGCESGVDVSKKLYDKGLRNLYLISGYFAPDFAKPDWVIGLKSKRPEMIIL